MATVAIIVDPLNDLNANGTFTYAPAGNFNGIDSFTYQANDATSHSNVATVNVTVNPVTPQNGAPVIVTSSGQPTSPDSGASRREGPWDLGSPGPFCLAGPKTLGFGLIDTKRITLPPDVNSLL